MSSQAGKVTYCQRVCKCDPQRGKGIEKGPGVGSLLCTDVNLKIRHICKFSSVQFSSVAQSCPTLCDPMNRSMPGLPVHPQLPEFTQTQSIESVMPSSHLILCHPFLLLPPIPPSIRVFSNESTLRMRWPKLDSFAS